MGGRSFFKYIIHLEPSNELVLYNEFVNELKKYECGLFQYHFSEDSDWT